VVALPAPRLAGYSVRLGLLLWLIPTRRVQVLDYPRGKREARFGRYLLVVSLAACRAAEVDMIVGGFFFSGWPAGAF
jgi:hypothetical protein